MRRWPVVLTTALALGAGASLPSTAFARVATATTATTARTAATATTARTAATATTATTAERGWSSDASIRPIAERLLAAAGWPAAATGLVDEVARLAPASEQRAAADASKAGSVAPRSSGPALTQSVTPSPCSWASFADTDPVEGHPFDVTSYAHHCSQTTSAMVIDTAAAFSPSSISELDVAFSTDDDPATGDGGADYVVTVFYDANEGKLLGGVLRTPTADDAHWRLTSAVEITQTARTQLTIAWPTWATAAVSFFGYQGRASAGGQQDSFPDASFLTTPLQQVATTTNPWGPSRFVPLANPQRLLDTRNGLGAPAGPRAPGAQLVVPVRGRVGMPNDPAVTAVVMNVTAVDATRPGYIQVFPTNQATVGAFSNLNPDRAGQVIPNLAVVPIGDGGNVTFYTTAGGHLLADVAGYFVSAASATSGRFVPITPTRALDTRRTGGAIPAGTTIAVGLPVVPVGATGVVLNVTMTQTGGPGYVTVYPDGRPRPVASNLNADQVGQTIPNLVVVPPGPAGVKAYLSLSTHLVVDVLGYFTPASSADATSGLFVPIRPSRLQDTRRGYPNAAKPAAGNSVEVSVRDRAGIPATGVSGALLNLTAADAAGAGYVTAFASEDPRPPTSNLNVDRVGQTIANAAVVKIDKSWASLYTLDRVHLLADAFGWFTA